MSTDWIALHPVLTTNPKTNPPPGFDRNLENREPREKEFYLIDNKISWRAHTLFTSDLVPPLSANVLEKIKLTLINA